MKKSLLILSIVFFIVSGISYIMKPPQLTREEVIEMQLEEVYSTPAGRIAKAENAILGDYYIEGMRVKTDFDGIETGYIGLMYDVTYWESEPENGYYEKADVVFIDFFCTVVELNEKLADNMDIYLVSESGNRYTDVIIQTAYLEPEVKLRDAESVAAVHRKDGKSLRDVDYVVIVGLNSKRLDGIDRALFEIHEKAAYY